VMEARVPMAAVGLPLFPMFLDAAVTLLQRALRGDRITQPHRTHLYQRLANGGWGHGLVSGLYAAAAAAGALVALLHRSAAWPIAVSVYAAGVVVVGAALSRAVPFTARPQR
jgi:UDP-N-acetylmuramyl pentapeptide phosphotransferase/UDP-N-acetylglucosamine-1-phosphate transferase